MSEETIFALASGAGRGGVAVLRISGPRAGPALAALTLQGLPAPRRASLRRLFDAASGEALDDALILWFPKPDSFTGEDVAELHVHGGRAVVAAVTDVLADVAGLRIARPGEFTRRAFENGRLDLAQAEGLADLIDAETEGQRRQALRQMEGGLSRLALGWAERLTGTLALLEAEIDFPDEGLPRQVTADIQASLEGLADDLENHLATCRRGESVREGFRIAILGAPNSGKSTLLNKLLGREAAIVSEIAGTTRDVVEGRIEITGFPVWIADTAGLHETDDPIEAEGVRRAKACAEAADLRLLVVDSTTEAPPPSHVTLAVGDLVLLNKMDMAGVSYPPTTSDILRISAKTGQGLTGLKARLEQTVLARLAQDEAVPLSRARHREAVQLAIEAIQRAKLALSKGAELAAEDLRLANRAIGRLTGRFDVEQVLDAVFAKFCIGK